MDPRWRIKKNEWLQESVSALRFFEEARLLFARDELLQQFPVLLEYYLRSDILKRLHESALKTTRSDFHIQTISNYLEESTAGVFVIERHLPPDLEVDRAILMEAWDRAAASE